MRINTIHNKIEFENTIIDYKEFRKYPAVTERVLENYYDEFVANTGRINEYFSDTGAFKKAVDDLAGKKRAKLIARKTAYPFLFGLRLSDTPFYSIFNKDKARLTNNNFIAAHCLLSIPAKNADDPKTLTGLESKLAQDIKKKFIENPGYEAIIEIPNNENPNHAKVSLFHEAKHYLIARYETETGKDVAGKFANRQFDSENDRAIFSRFTNEYLVELLSDKILEYDKQALFERRWSENIVFRDSNYSNMRGFLAMATGITFGIILFQSFSHPFLFPFLFAPRRAADLIEKRYKNKMKKVLLEQDIQFNFKL